MSILLLDACRDNPLAEQLSRSMGTRSSSVGRGLAKIETGVGTYIGFSTQPGDVALDGDGDNRPFALALIDNIRKPDVDIELMMRQVRADVIKQTRGSQVRWGNSSMVGGFAFSSSEVAVVGPRPLSVPSAATDSRNSDMEIVFWNTIKDSNDPALLQAYIEQFPNGVFVAIASVLLGRLEADANAAAQQSQVASLQPADQAPARSSGEPEPDMVVNVQQELDRLGCDPGRPDGLWGSNSERAPAAFARYGNLQLDTLEPSQQLLDVLRDRSEREWPSNARSWCRLAAPSGAIGRDAWLHANPEPPPRRAPCRPPARPALAPSSMERTLGSGVHGAVSQRAQLVNLFRSKLFSQLCDYFFVASHY